MKRLLNLFLAALFAFAPVAQADLRASSGAFGPATITSGTITGSPLVNGITTIIGKSGIPFVSAPTGTMANNGVATMGTALPAAYANAFFFMPAGSVAAGVPAAAGWLFGQCTTTTACVLCNNAYTSGAPTIPTCTPFVTTGPGAFTGDTTEEFGITFTVPANTLNKNGGLRLTLVGQVTPNNVNAKNFRIRYSGNAGTIVHQQNATSFGALSVGAVASITNRGATNAQVGSTVAVAGVANAGNGPAIIGADTTAATTIVYSLQKAVATDVMVLESTASEALSDGT